MNGFVSVLCIAAAVVISGGILNAPADIQSTPAVAAEPMMQTTPSTIFTVAKEASACEVCPYRGNCAIEVTLEGEVAEPSADNEAVESRRPGVKVAVVTVGLGRRAVGAVIKARPLRRIVSGIRARRACRRH